MGKREWEMLVLVLVLDFDERVSWFENGSPR